MDASLRVQPRCFQPVAATTPERKCRVSACRALAQGRLTTHGGRCESPLPAQKTAQAPDALWLRTFRLGTIQRELRGRPLCVTAPFKAWRRRLCVRAARND